MKRILNEGLDYHDLVGQIEPKITVDEYAAKMGDDDEIVTLAFTVKGQQVGEDLVGWLERGYEWIIDATVSKGEIEVGKYLVFAELYRRSNVPTRIIEILTDLNNLFDKVNTGRYHLCGHNVKNFDIPYIQKRMIINGIKPSSFLPGYNTKPWEMKVVDTLEIWKFGNPSSLASLELMCSSLGVESSKDGEVTGNRVHESYWIDGKLEQIKEYCEKDVDVLIQIIKELKELV